MDKQKLKSYGLHKRRGRSNEVRVGDTGNNAWKNKKWKIKGQPIIEMEANREVIDTHTCLGKKRFQIKREKTIYVKNTFSFDTQ